MVFTATDSLGATAVDSLILTVNPINHAPVLTLKSPTLLATTWKGTQTFALAAAVWDDATPSQTGHYDLQLANAMDSVYLTSLNMDSTGTLHVSAKLDTSVGIGFRIRAHDNGGTANGGVDTSAWSSVQALQLVDTVLDAQGNSYRARRMPDGKVWMRSNMRDSTRNTPDTTFTCPGFGCESAGILYSTIQAFTYGAEYNTALYNAPAQGVCPSGWHIAAHTEWTKLFIATMPTGSSDSTYGLRRDSAFSSFGVGGSHAYLTGGNLYGSFITPNGSYVMSYESWVFLPSEVLANKPKTFGLIYQPDSTYSAPSRAGIRCIRN